VTWGAILHRADPPREVQCGRVRSANTTGAEFVLDGGQIKTL
jgi:hypothetical protein